MAILATIGALSCRALHAVLALLAGAALLCALARAQDSFPAVQLLESGQVHPEGAGLVPSASFRGRDTPVPAFPGTGELLPDPADIPAQGRGGGTVTTVSLSLGTATVAESGGGARTVRVTAALGGAAIAAEEVAVQLTIDDDGTAVEGVDYTAIAAIPTPRIAARGSAATVSFTLTLTDDDTVEANETVVVTGTAPGYTVVPATLTITDSDRATVGVSRGPLYLLHSERGRHFSFSVTLDVPVDAEVEVPWSVHTPVSPDALTFTPPGSTTQSVVQPTGAEPADVTPSSGTVTLGGHAGMVSSPITLEVVRDDLSEGYESVEVEVGTPVVQPQGISDRVALAASPRVVVGHIGPSDPVTILFVGPDTVNEGGMAIFTVSVLGPATPTAPLTLTSASWNTSAANVSDDDYSVRPVPVIIPAGGRSAPFTVFAATDSRSEGDETFTIGFHPDDATGGGEGGISLYPPYSRREITIVDALTVGFDLPRECIGFFICRPESTLSVSRGAPGVEVILTLSERPGRTVEIPIGVSLAAGVTPDDYSGVPATVTFGPRQTRRSFTMTAAAGSVASGERVGLGFGTLPDGVSSRRNHRYVTMSLVALRGTISLSVNPTSLQEGIPVSMTLSATVVSDVGGQGFTVLAYHPNPLTPDRERGRGDLVSGVYRSDLAADGYIDYRPPDARFTVSGPRPGLQLEVSRDGIVDPYVFRNHATDDGLVEQRETVITMTAYAPGYVVQPATYTIWDDSSATLMVTPVQVQETYREGSVISFVPLLDAPVEAMVTFDFSVSNAAGDVSPATGTHSFHGIYDVRRRGGNLYAGPLFHITVTDDSLSEGRETFQLSVTRVATSPPILDSSSQSRVRAYALGSIPDPYPDSSSSIDLDDPAPLSLSIEPSDPVTLSLSGADTVVEGTAAIYTVSVVQGGVHRNPVTVDISAEGAGAGDLSGVPMSVVIPTGRTTATFRVNAVADGAGEGDETFTVMIANPTGGGGGGFRRFVSRKETTILETAAPTRVTASFAQGFLTVVEGAVASVTVRLNTAPGRALDIPVVWRHEGGAGLLDHGEIAGTVRVGSRATVGVLTVSAVADAKDEVGERLRLRFGALPVGVVAGDPDQAVVLIADSVPRGIVRLSANRASVPEGFDGNITVTASVDGTPPVSSLRVTLSEEPTDGDHTLSPGTLPVVTIPARQSRGTATLGLVVPQDGVVEPVRAVVVTAVASGHAVEPLSVAVIDDDRAALDIATHEESDRKIRLEVTLEGQVDGRVSVPWSAVGAGIDGNDVDPAAGTVVFEPNAGETRLFNRLHRATAHTTVTILDDQLSEGDENARFRLEDPTVSPGGNEMADRIALRRGQSGAWSVTDSPDPLSVAHTGAGGMTAVAEGATVTHTVALQGDNRHTAPVTVDLSATLIARGGHDAAEATDFSLPSSVVIPVNATSAPVTITVIDDTVVESTETFEVSISGVRGGGGDGFRSPAFGDGWTIAINDNDTATVSFAEERVWFFRQGAVQTVTAGISVPPEQVLTVSITTNLGGGASGFSGIPASLVFGSGVTLRSFGVTLDRDIAMAPSDAHIGLTASPGAVVGAPSRLSLIVREPPMFLRMLDDDGVITLGTTENAQVGRRISSLIARAIFVGDPDFHLYFWDGATAATTLGPFGIDRRSVRVAWQPSLGGTRVPVVDENGIPHAAHWVDVRQALDYETPPTRFTSSLAIFPRPVEDIPQARLASSVANTVPVVITVSDTNELPRFSSSTTADSTLVFTVAENTAMPLSLGIMPEAIDPEGDSFRYFFWEGRQGGLLHERTGSVSDALGPLALDGRTLRVGLPLDHETDSDLTVTVGVSDFLGRYPDNPNRLFHIPTPLSSDRFFDRVTVSVTVTDVNEPPEFDGLPESGTLSLSVDEHSAAGTAVGDPVSVTDPEGDILTYSLAEDDDPSTPSAAGLFGIDSAGQVTVAVGAVLDHEVAASHTVVIAVSDGKEAGFGTDPAVDVRATAVIAVADVNRAPTFGAQPLSRTVLESAEAGATVGPPVPATDPEGDTLSYSLEEDGDPGTPSTAALFGIDATGQITVSSGATLDSAASPHTVIVAVSDGKNAAFGADPAIDARVSVTVTVLNEPPEFDSLSSGETLSWSVAENSGTGTAVGAPVSATDPEEDTLSYLLGEDDNPVTPPAADLFGIDGAGQVTVAPGVILDHETAASHTVVVLVSDGQNTAGVPDSSADISATVVIEVSDVNEAPGVPGPPVAETLSVAAGGHTRLSLVWTESSNTGPVVFYEVEYKETAGTTDADYIGAGDSGYSVTHDGTSTTATVTGLQPGIGYDLRVRAVNAEGESDWASVSGTTRANTLPEFAAATVTLTVAENTAVGTDLGDPITVEVDDTDVLEYMLAGTGNTLFIIDADGQASVAAAIDFEDLETADVAVTTLSLDLTVADPFGAEGTVSLEIQVTDVEEAPGVPGSLTVAVADPADSLSVGWTAPENAGPTVESYEIEYRRTSDVVWGDALTVAATETSVTIADLEDETGYDVRVRAVNAEGAGAWAETAIGTGVGLVLRLLDPGAEQFTGADALLLFYFTEFNGLLSNHPALSRIVIGSLLPVGTTRPDDELDAIAAGALALGAAGGIPDAHPANVYSDGGFNSRDALLIYYALQFGPVLSASPVLLDEVVNRLLPSGHGLSGAERRALIQSGRNLASTL